MSAQIICFSAARVARMLRQNTSPDAAAHFIDHMAQLARTQRDARREAFWAEVAGMMRRRPAVRPLERAPAAS